jgi:hypothetical protein
MIRLQDRAGDGRAVVRAGKVIDAGERRGLRKKRDL